LRRHAAHHRSPTSAKQPAGQDLRMPEAPRLQVLPLQTQRDASPFWIILLLVYARSKHEIIG